MKPKVNNHGNTELLVRANHTGGVETHRPLDTMLSGTRNAGLTTRVKCPAPHVGEGIVRATMKVVEQPGKGNTQPVVFARDPDVRVFVN